MSYLFVDCILILVDLQFNRGEFGLFRDLLGFGVESSRGDGDGDGDGDGEKKFFQQRSHQKFNVFLFTPPRTLYIFSLDLLRLGFCKCM